MHNKYVTKNPHVGIEVQADFTDDSKKKINAKALSSFFAAEQNLEYKISFVLIENGIKGINKLTIILAVRMERWEVLKIFLVQLLSIWTTSTYELQLWRNKRKYPTSVEADETIEYAAQLEVPGNVQNADNLYLVALLLNSKGEIENAAETKVMPNPTMSITDNRNLLVPEFSFANGTLNVNGFAGKVFIYNVYGVEVPNRDIPSGIYIIKCVDGNNSFVKKMVLK